MVLPISTRTAVHGRRLLAAIACGLALAWMIVGGVPSARAEGSSTGLPAGGEAVLADTGGAQDSASLVQCLTAGEPSERAATFAGEMTAIGGTARMSMRVQLLEWMEGETGYHVVAAPGLGVWRTADPGVSVFKYVKQITDLSAPAAYRGLISFRWQGPHGRTIKHEQRRTSRCLQPAPPPAPSPPPAPAPAPSSPSTPAASSSSLE